MSAPDATKPVGAGTVLSGRYRLVRLVANGGMASVWEAHDNVLARSVAVKMLHPHLAGDRLFLERFRREAVSAARLAHPNVVATFDAGITPEGTAFIVMELIRGRTLSAFATDHRPLPIFVCIEIGMQIAEALAHAHGAGLVHRDIKPANVLVCDIESDGVPIVKVTDFGIAKAAEGLGLELTRTGMILGTPKYLSPEQIEGLEPDARGDIYSLGVVLFELVAGMAPFRGPTEMAVAVRHLNETPPPIRELRPGAPPALEDLVARMLAKRPQDRPQSAVAVRQALSAIEARGRHDPARHDPGRHDPARHDPGRSPTVASGPVGGPLAAGAGQGAAGAGAGPVASGPVALGRAGPKSSRPAAGAPSRAMPQRLSERAPTTVAQGQEGRSGPPSRPPPPPGMPRAPRANPAPVARRPNWAGRVVAGLVVVALIVVVVVIARQGSSNTGGPLTSTTSGSGGGNSITIQSAAVFHVERDADHAATVGYAIDHDLDTSWQTDVYHGPNFANLRHGLGLALTLDSTQTLHTLHVVSSTSGWSAEVYVAGAVPDSAALAPWGVPVDVKQAINGNTTFDLHGRRAGAILLWLTDLGPTFQASIAEVTAT